LYIYSAAPKTTTKKMSNREEHKEWEKNHQEDWNRRCKSKCLTYKSKKKCNDKALGTGLRRDKKVGCAEVCEDCVGGKDARGKLKCFVCKDARRPYKNMGNVSGGSFTVCMMHSGRCVKCGESTVKYGHQIQACPLCWNTLSSSLRSKCCFSK
jgi:hypothetical protein